jgi:UDP-glucose 4-epimerase
LRLNATAVVRRLFPETEALYRARQWTLFPGIDRVYDSSLAARELGWESRYDFRHVLNCLRDGMDFRSSLAREVGSKGYHSEVFTEGPYPVR